MKIERYKKPISSFLSVEKDAEIILDKLYSNPRLKRLLYRLTPDALNAANLTDEESQDLFKKNYISVIPTEEKKEAEGPLCQIFITFDSFLPSSKNPHFRDNCIGIDIICHFDVWQLDNGSLRPFKIAGEIDSMLDGARLSGIGVLNFLGADYISVKEGFGGYSLVYRATHAEDDEQGFNNPADEERFLEDFEAGLNG